MSNFGCNWGTIKEVMKVLNLEDEDLACITADSKHITITANTIVCGEPCTIVTTMTPKKEEDNQIIYRSNNKGVIK